MKKYLIAGVLAATMATNANAAASLTSAEVRGPSGTVWNTAVDGFYTLFLQRPYGNIINPTDNFTSTPTTVGPTPNDNNFAIAGDGFPAGTSANSDLSYTLTLMFADGATILGNYSFVPGTGGTFSGGTSDTRGATTYTLTGFGWDRSPADNVSQNTAVRGNDPADYSGQFAYTAIESAVPEPATWAMMLFGFGMVGGAARYRRKSTNVVFA